MNPVYSLQNINTWWKTGEVDPYFLHKRIRSEFTEILKSLGSNRITNLVGPSNVGKTSLLYQIVNQLIHSQVPPERIMLFGGDEMTLFGEHRSIGSVMEIFATDLLHENLFSLRAPVYVLIDDIHLIDDWQIYLINYIQKTTNIKFIITEALSGLANRELPADTDIKITVMPLTQPQFAEFYGAYKSSDIDLIRFKSLLPETSLFSDPKGYYEELSANIYPLSEFKPYKAKIMNEYLLCGGYPGYFSSASAREWQASLLKIIDHTLYFDIAASYNIKSPQKLKKLLYLIASKGDHEQSYGSIGRALYVDTSTIIGYISFLHDSGFASAAENYSLNSSKNGRVIRKNKRFYIFDTGICNSLLRNTDTAINYGGFVTQSCRYMACEYAIDAGGEIFFWKDGSREVDIVVSAGNTLLPISVNYQLDFSDRCAKSLKVFMRLHDAKNAVIITKDVLKSEDGIFYIPYWMI